MTPSWTTEMMARLRALWIADELSTAEIATTFGLSKNAIVGKAHRMHLPPKPSPIIRSGARRPYPQRAKKPQRAPAVTLPQFAPVPVPAPAPIAQAPAIVAAAAPPPPRIRIVEPAAPIVPQTKFLAPRSAPCCWPIGEPGTRSFRYCEDASVAGRSYCEAHASRAYVRVQDRRENAA